MNFTRPKIYDDDGNEIIPPEDANGFVVGEHGKFAWTTSKNYKTTFINTPEPYTGPMAEDVEETFKFAEVPIITNDTWYHRMKGIKTRMKTRVLKLRRKI